ncbi:MAG: NAD(+) kinase [Gammaproteobacteria bacterium CG22_combo_CG10-13_8_21_14_all_40_8]|nr:MAG: NAD(+) kinase [Gammaproteobacteria bacterium CG22_combo_CG10-13_8_21_14_all_40_8]
MDKHFTQIGIMGKPSNLESADTIRLLYDVLQKNNCQILVQNKVGEELGFPLETHCEPHKLADLCDLIIVVGGDGSLLHAGRLLAEKNIPVVGINRGSLGFLTDVQPSKLETSVTEILHGNYRKAQRFLLKCHVTRDGEDIGASTALNDIVLFPGKIAGMIEFEIYINEQFVYHQKSDGLITSTPTGSTAYSLSAGGPILHPNLNALVLVPMFPHTLSSRPIVVNGDSRIKIVVSTANKSQPQLSCDGQVQISLAPGDIIHVEKSANPLVLLHPVDYDYYHILRSKLGWSSKA